MRPGKSPGRTNQPPEIPQVQSPPGTPLPQSGGRIPAVTYGAGFIGAYERGAVSAFNPKNSSRIHDLMRAGNIYLSLQDAIALALENNLDLQWERYVVQTASTDTLRAEAAACCAVSPVRQ